MPRPTLLLPVYDTASDLMPPAKAGSVNPTMVPPVEYDTMTAGPARPEAEAVCGGERVGTGGKRAGKTGAGGNGRESEQEHERCAGLLTASILVPVLIHL